MFAPLLCDPVWFRGTEKIRWNSPIRCKVNHTSRPDRGNCHQNRWEGHTHTHTHTHERGIEKILIGQAFNHDTEGTLSCPKLPPLNNWQQLCGISGSLRHDIVKLRGKKRRQRQRALISGVSAARNRKTAKSVVHRAHKRR